MKVLDLSRLQPHALGRGYQGEVRPAEAQYVRLKMLLEGAISCSMSHPNIVQTYWYSRTPPEGSPNRHELCHVIMEYCDKKNLLRALKKNIFQQEAIDGSTQPNMEVVLPTLNDVCSALYYLHTLNIIHQDLKPQNVLLRSSKDDARGFVAKVSDFGMSMLFKEVERSTEGPQVVSSCSHLAPELIRGDRAHPPADVYSFGILMWEIIHCQPAFQSTTKAQILERVASGERPAFTETCSEDFISLAQQCWAEDPAQRPTFKVIKKRLRTLG